MTVLPGIPPDTFGSTVTGGYPGGNCKRNMDIFGYDPAILARYPQLVGGVLLARGVSNGPATEALTAAYRAEQGATVRRLGEGPLSQVPSLAAWRRAFRDFGADPTQYRSAAEALLRRLTKSGEIPNVNALVDLGNLVSIRHALPVAVIDLGAVTGAITVRFAGGTERFTPLGAATAEQPPAGEVIFADEAGVVLARRWCWRQSAESAAGPATTDVLIAVEAQHTDGRAGVEAALHDLQELLAVATGGKGDVAGAAVLDRERTIFTV